MMVAVLPLMDTMLEAMYMTDVEEGGLGIWHSLDGADGLD